MNESFPMHMNIDITELKNEIKAFQATVDRFQEITRDNTRAERELLQQMEEMMNDHLEKMRKIFDPKATPQKISSLIRQMNELEETKHLLIKDIKLLSEEATNLRITNEALREISTGGGQ